MKNSFYVHKLYIKIPNISNYGRCASTIDMLKSVWDKMYIFVLFSHKTAHIFLFFIEYNTNAIDSTSTASYIGADWAAKLLSIDIDY